MGQSPMDDRLFHQPETTEGIDHFSITTLVIIDIYFLSASGGRGHGGFTPHGGGGGGRWWDTMLFAMVWAPYPHHSKKHQRL